MKRFFAETEGGRVKLTGDEAHHAIHVMRMKKGDMFIACGGDETEYVSEITEITDDTVYADIKDIIRSAAEPKTKVTIFQGLPKGDKLELIIQKAVELGVYEIVPVQTKRAVVKIEDKKKAQKTQRWNKISESAAKQSGRGIVPEVKEPVSFKTAAEMMKDFDLSIVAYEEEREITLKSVLKSVENVETIGIFIGPEGGIAPEEFEVLTKNGAKSVTLGRRILRTETAPLAMLAMIMYEYGE